MKSVWIWTFDFILFLKKHIKMHKIWFLLDVFMNVWNLLLNMNFENTCLNAWNLIFCSLFFFFCNGVFMKEWNFLLNLNFEFEWKCMFQYIKFDFFCTAWRMHLWIHESLIEYEFQISMKMHVWVYEIWFFYSFWRMDILKHEILFFIFIFSDDNEWNSIFLNDHFDADVCTSVFFFKVILQMMIFPVKFS